MVQLKCPETVKLVDLGDVPPEAHLARSLWSRPVACPHCGKKHSWTSWQLGLAMETLRRSPEATRVLVEDGSATALP
jgi:hypothetical protein